MILSPQECSSEHSELDPQLQFLVQERSQWSKESCNQADCDWPRSWHSIFPGLGRRCSRLHRPQWVLCFPTTWPCGLLTKRGVSSFLHQLYEIEITSNKMHPVKVYSLLGEYKFMPQYKPYHNQDTKYVHHSRKFPCVPSHSVSHLHPSFRQLQICFLSL